MILYRTAPQLRIRRLAAPSPPFWAASIVAPYSGRRDTPLAVDLVELRATASERAEVLVCEEVTAQLERSDRLAPPLLVDAAGRVDSIYRRGPEASRSEALSGLGHFTLVTSDGIPESQLGDLVVATWPADLALIRSSFAAAGARRELWGAFVPVFYPLTTDLGFLAEVAAAAAGAGARFLAAAAVDLEPAAKHVVARSLSLDGDAYDLLFHSDLDAIHIATERHIAALAHEAKLADHVLVPQGTTSNWEAAVLLTLAASRMLAMAHETELAGSLARSARVVAGLDKPIEVIGEAASLAIVESLDEVSVDILTEWLESGRSVFAERIDEMWRLRRDHFS